MTVDQLPRVIKERLIRDEQERHEAHAITESPTRFALTELLYCLRKAYYDRTDWLPKPISALWRMKPGSLMDYWWCQSFPRRQQRVTYVVYGLDKEGDVFGAPTVTVSGIFDVEDEDGAIADCKFVRSPEPTRNKGPGRYYVEQVVFYCYCESKRIGRIHLGAHSDYERVDIPIDDKLVEEVMSAIEERATTLYLALHGKNDYPAMNARSPAYRWECDGCQYAERCAKEAGP